MTDNYYASVFRGDLNPWRHLTARSPGQEVVDTCNTTVATLSASGGGSSQKEPRTPEQDIETGTYLPYFYVLQMSSTHRFVTRMRDGAVCTGNQ